MKDVVRKRAHVLGLHLIAVLRGRVTERGGIRIDEGIRLRDEDGGPGEMHLTKFCDRDGVPVRFATSRWDTCRPQVTLESISDL